MGLNIFFRQTAWALLGFNCGTDVTSLRKFLESELVYQFRRMNQLAVVYSGDKRAG